ncbi:MAG: RNA-binding S4 domain-containing protein [Firmicutes bacterium]|nr:RNA-binding S4 domain-containing protein [Bacillota bacterium]HHY15585.1 RNA-binding S4 domain-containing protein [Bacillota bacterium]
MEEIKIKTDTIQLDQLLKWANVVASGGEGKFLIQSGAVFVNGEVEKRRAAKIKPGDIVELAGQTKFIVGREP